nr:HEAT repeat domain-containing protein [Pseudomonas toyotomiensis]
MDLLDEIDAIDISSPDAKKLLLKTVKSEDPEARLRSIEKISLLLSDVEILSTLQEHLRDTDELVRLACIEAIEDHLDTSSISKIKICLDDRDWMVRGQAAIALSKLGATDAYEIAEIRFKSCHDSEEKTRYCFALFLIDKKHLKEIKELYRGSGYRVRCAIANNLVDAIYFKWSADESLVLEVLEFLKDSLSNENQASVVSSLEYAVGEISDLRNMSEQ